ncbi:MAG: hypothetical protein Fur0032_03230 [Terrimicrobiaceae bacterium]
MNSFHSPRKQANPLDFGPLVRCLLFALAVGVAGLLYVYVKNQQHQLGQATREVERLIREERALNEVLLARITALSSRTELMRKLQLGTIALLPIQDHAIARLIPPTIVSGDEIARTASAELMTR